MAKGLLLLAAAMLAALATLAAAGTDDSIPESDFIVITMVNQEPEPVPPGEAFELRMRVENRGSKPANDVAVEILPQFPFYADEPVKQLGSLAGRQKGRDSVLVIFPLTADSRAGYGTNRLAVRYKTAEQGWTAIDSFNITVGQRELPLTISSVTPKPEILVPGEKAALWLELANAGSGAARNVRIRLNLTGDSPFAAYGAGSEAVISEIGASQKGRATFQIITQPDAESGIYAISAFISYSDSSGRNYTASGQSFGLKVGAEPRLAASQLDTGLVTTGATKTVTVELINKGLADVKFLTAKAAASDSYEVVSSDSAYVGDLDSGDSETVSYDVFFTREAPLTLELEYYDQLNRQGSMKIDVPVKIYSDSEAGRYGLKKAGRSGILIAAAIVVIGVLAYRRFRRKR